MIVENRGHGTRQWHGDLPCKKIVWRVLLWDYLFGTGALFKHYCCCLIDRGHGPLLQVGLLLQERITCAIAIVELIADEVRSYRTLLLV